MNNSVIGLDIAKNIFHIYIDRGESGQKETKTRKITRFFCQLPSESNWNRSVWKCPPLGKRINKIRTLTLGAVQHRGPA